MRVTKVSCPRHYDEGVFSGYKSISGNLRDTAERVTGKSPLPIWKYINIHSDVWVEELLSTGTQFLTEEEHREVAYRLLSAKLRRE